MNKEQVADQLKQEAVQAIIDVAITSICDIMGKSARVLGLLRADKKQGPDIMCKIVVGVSKKVAKGMTAFEVSEADFIASIRNQLEDRH